MAAAAQSEPIYILLCEAGGLMRNSVVQHTVPASRTYSDTIHFRPSRRISPSASFGPHVPGW